MRLAPVVEDSRARLGDNNIKPGNIAIIPPLALCTIGITTSLLLQELSAKDSLDNTRLVVTIYQCCQQYCSLFLIHSIETVERDYMLSTFEQKFCRQRSEASREEEAKQSVHRQ